MRSNITMASMQEMQLILKARGIPFAGFKKQLVDLYAIDLDTGVEVDLNGLNEELTNVIASQLQVGENDYRGRPFMSSRFIDIYNH